jgi:hypothetical protein
MTLKRQLMCAVFAVAAIFPATAGAQLQIAPPQGDSTGDMINLGSLRPTPSVVGFDADTTTYTTEAGEFNQCGQSVYGNTIWSTFRTPRFGRLDVTAAGYDSVIGLARIQSGRIQGGPCSDRIGGRIESFRRDALPRVKKNATYALQVGGFQQPDGSFARGPLEVAVELLAPEAVSGDAILTYRFGRGGIKVTSIRVDGPPDAVAVVFCAPRCGRDTRLNLKPTVFRQPVQKVDVARREGSDGGRFVTAPAPKLNHPLLKDAEAVASAKTAFRGRKIKNGRTLFVAILAEDRIGQIFFWRIRKNVAGTKQLGCIEPGSTRVKRIRTCTGV